VRDAAEGAAGAEQLAWEAGVRGDREAAALGWLASGEVFDLLRDDHAEVRVGCRATLL